MRAAELCSPVTETGTGNTAPGTAAAAPGGRRKRMERDLITRVVCYRAAMSLAGEMLESGMISAEEYEKIDTMIAKKYGLSSCTIFHE